MEPFDITTAHPELVEGERLSTQDRLREHKSLSEFIVTESGYPPKAGGRGNVTEPGTAPPSFDKLRMSGVVGEEVPEARQSGMPGSAAARTAERRERSNLCGCKSLFCFISGSHCLY